MNKHRIMMVLGFVLSGVFLWLFLRDVEWRALGAALGQAHVGIAVLAASIHFTTFGLRVLRWRILLRPIKKVRLETVFSVSMIGYMANCILPARAGEVIKPWLLSVKERTAFSATLATVVVERVTDLLGLLIIFGSLLPFLPENLGEIRRGAMIFAVFVLAGCAGLLSMAAFPRRWERLIHRICSFLPDRAGAPLAGFATSFLSGFLVVREPRWIIQAVMLSVLNWLGVGVAMYVMFFAFDLRISPIGALLVLFGLVFAIAVPQAPGFVGVFQWATKEGLKLMGASTSSAAAYAVVLWTAFIVPTIAAGLACLWKEGVSLGELRRGAETDSAGEGTGDRSHDACEASARLERLGGEPPRG